MADPKQPNILDSIVAGTYDPIASVPGPLQPALAPTTTSDVPNVLTEKAPSLGTQAQFTAPAQSSDNAERNPAEGGSLSNDGKTLTLPPQTAENSDQHLSPHEHVGILKTIGRLAGGAFGISNPNSSPEAGLGARIGALAGRTGNALAEAAGTPEEKQLAEERAQMPLKTAQTLSLMGYRQQQGNAATQNAASKSLTAQTGAKTEQDKYSLGDAAMGLPEGTTRMTAEAAQQNAASNEGLRNARQKQIEASLNGQVHVMPEIAHVIGRPELADQNLSPIQYQQQVANVLKSLNIKNQDLGDEGVWGTSPLTGRITRLGDSPSMAANQRYMNRPVAAYNPETQQIEYMSGGQAVAQHAAPAGPAQQIMSKQAQFSDIYSGIGSMRAAINGISQEPLDAATIAKLTMASRETDPTVYHQAIDTILGSEQLTPAQQDFIVAQRQLQERAMSLRNLAGMGNASDQLRAAINATLPTAKSGNVQMMRKQLDAVTNLVDNLHTGIPNINTGAPKKGTTTPKSSTPPANNSAGELYQFPDGSHRMVSADKVQRAIAAGAKKAQ